MKYEYAVVIEATATGFSAYSPDLPGCVSTGANKAEVLANMRDAIKFHLDGLRKDGEPIPPPRTMTEPPAKLAQHSHGSSFNLPNQLTSLRLALSVVLFGFIAAEHYLVGLVLFLIAVGTDWLDGHYARKYNQITTLGRILDPFADKVIICGTFIFILVAPGMSSAPWGLRAWMVVVIVGRELLVTALRSFLEEKGSDFSANMSGKLKMVLQCVAAASSLVFLACRGPLNPALLGDFFVPAWLYWTTIVSIWAAIVLTVYSGAIYVWIAYKLLKPKAGAGDA
jgi:CDP-diacylglycerol---glycerol-3-phosphate 3-phosphatidyltransferase